MTELEIFNKSIENSVIKIQKDLYLESIEKLYSGIWTDKDILKHIKLLKEVQPARTGFDDWLLEVYNLSYRDFDKYSEPPISYYEHLHKTECLPKRQLTPNDFKIAKILKLRVQGASITISPKECTIAWRDLLDQTAKINSIHLKDAVYWIEFYTDGCPNGTKPHIHMAAHLYDISKVNTLASYIRKKFKGISCSVEKKHDITYLLQDYHSGNASADAKKKYKKLDKEKRQKLKIPETFNL